MYNEEQKQEYIDFENSNRDSLRRYFVRVASKENEYEKDIADMDVDELKDTILSLDIRREESRSHLISLLRGYINWAILNEKTECFRNAIDKITPENTNSHEVIRQTMIRNPEHMHELLQSSLDYVDYENKSSRDSLVFWLLYCGIEIEKIPLLRKDSIDRDSETVKTDDGQQYKVSDEVMELWDKCAEMTYLERKNSKSINAKSKNVNEYIKSWLIDNEYLFRPIEGNNPDKNRLCPLNTFRNIIANAFQDKEKNIPARNLNYSGKFYQIYLLEKENGQVSMEAFAEKFGINYSSESELVQKTRKWRTDYENWKLAFGYM